MGGGEEKRIEMYYEHGPIPHTEYNHYALQICTNSNFLKN